VTADIGEDPILVVWDSFSGAPVKTIFNPHRNGVKAIDISNDSMYIISLSEREEVSGDTCVLVSPPLLLLLLLFIAFSLALTIYIYLSMICIFILFFLLFFYFNSLGSSSRSRCMGMDH
jgi:hypothetical protein